MAELAAEKATKKTEQSVDQAGDNAAAQSKNTAALLSAEGNLTARPPEKSTSANAANLPDLPITGSDNGNMRSGAELLKSFVGDGPMTGQHFLDIMKSMKPEEVPLFTKAYEAAAPEVAADNIAFILDRASMPPATQAAWESALKDMYASRTAAKAEASQPLTRAEASPQAARAEASPPAEGAKTSATGKVDGASLDGQQLAAAKVTLSAARDSLSRLENQVLSKELASGLQEVQNKLNAGDPASAAQAVKTWNDNIANLLKAKQLDSWTSQKLTIKTNDMYAPPEAQNPGFSSANPQGWENLVNNTQKSGLTGYGLDMDNAMLNQVAVVNKSLEQAMDAAKAGGAPLTLQSIDKLISDTDQMGHSGASAAMLNRLIIATAREDVGRKYLQLLQAGKPASEQVTYENFVKSFDSKFGGTRTNALPDTQSAEAAKPTKATRPTETTKATETAKPTETAPPAEQLAKPAETSKPGEINLKQITDESQLRTAIEQGLAQAKAGKPVTFDIDTRVKLTGADGQPVSGDTQASVLYAELKKAYPDEAYVFSKPDLKPGDPGYTEVLAPEITASQVHLSSKENAITTARDISLPDGTRLPAGSKFEVGTIMDGNTLKSADPSGKVWASTPDGKFVQVADAGKAVTIPEGSISTDPKQSGQIAHQGDHIIVRTSKATDPDGKPLLDAYPSSASDFDKLYKPGSSSDMYAAKPKFADHLLLPSNITVQADTAYGASTASGAHQDYFMSSGFADARDATAKNYTGATDARSAQEIMRIRSALGMTEATQAEAGLKASEIADLKKAWGNLDSESNAQRALSDLQSQQALVYSQQQKVAQQARTVDLMEQAMGMKAVNPQDKDAVSSMLARLKQSAGNDQHADDRISDILSAQKDSLTAMQSQLKQANQKLALMKEVMQQKSDGNGSDGTATVARADIRKTVSDFSGTPSPEAVRAMVLQAVNDPAAMSRFLDQFSNPADKEAAKQMLDKVKGMSDEERAKFEERLGENPNKALGLADDGTGGGMGLGGKIGTAVAVLAIVSAAIMYARSARAATAPAGKKVPFFTPLTS